jgi:hypothetical protein
VCVPLEGLPLRMRDSEGGRGESEDGELVDRSHCVVFGDLYFKRCCWCSLDAPTRAIAERAW